MDHSPGDPLATKLSYLSYALIYSLLEDVEQEHPGTWQRVWTRARDMLQAHHLHDSTDEDWLKATIERKPSHER